MGDEVEVWVSQVKNEEDLRHSSLILSSDSIDFGGSPGPFLNC